MKFNKTIAITLMALLVFAGITAAYNLRPNIQVDVDDTAWAAKEIADVDTWAEETLKDAVEGDYREELKSKLLEKCYDITEEDLTSMDSAITSLDAILKLPM